MAQEIVSSWYFYQGWDVYQGYLVKAIESLTPEQLVLRREELELLYESVGKLSLEQQQVLQWRFGEGLRFAQIAILLNKREATVRKICSRSLALLRGIYHQH